jgi:alkanesulfonate monooxygenase SsuD/methylene tetrahydromethanopterin reductase-like flavin-dependent oxidoreductase (luciferase family)
MEIGIGVPGNVPGARGDLILEWARRADAGPFSSVGLVDRLAFPNYEPLMTLAAVAGVTQRIGLVTTILIATLRNGGLLAKQAASLDALSGGRLTLGLGIGTRSDDFAAAPAELQGRARRFEEQLALMKRIWAGEPVGPDAGPVGPPPARPGGPPILIGGQAPAAYRRTARWADGYVITGGRNVERVREAYGEVEAAWRAAGRPGRARLLVTAYYALGPDAAERSAAYIEWYYGFMGPERARGFARGGLSSPEMIREAIRAFAELGADELLFWPCVAELDQLERLQELVG